MATLTCVYHFDPLPVNMLFPGTHFRRFVLYLTKQFTKCDISIPKTLRKEVTGKSSKVLEAL